MDLQPLTYLAGDADGRIQVKHAKRAVSPVEVCIKVTHSSVCGTDLHDLTSGCGLGHEGVGIVQRVGEAVTAVKIGQRVRWGWQFSSCGRCRECLSGYRSCCPEACGQKYGDLEQGAFGDYVVKHQDFIYPIPDEIESRHAGPLNCAGITVYEALDVAQTKASDCVGIVGLGGLGHLGVMYARAMGCEVVVFSRNKAKRADALALGASLFSILPPQKDTEPGLKASINVMLLCGEGLPDFELIMPLLAPRATIVSLAIQMEPLVIPYMPFMLAGHRIIGSTEASRENHLLALKFAARHGIKPWIEDFPMSADGLSKALAALKDGRIRYRAILSAEVGHGA